MNRSILIVDDEPSICKALQRSLRRHRLTVYQANGGVEALELLATTAVDCIISDQRMPGMKGTEFLGIAREQFPDASRIILSGQSDLRDMEDAINIAGVQQFISKPWDDNQLLDAVNEALCTEPKLRVVAHDPPTAEQAAVAINAPGNVAQHQALERAIKNDELELIVDDYLSISLEHQSMFSLRIHWPSEATLSQDAIVSMAFEAGFSQSLMTWYLLQVVSYSGLSQQNQVMIVDLFDVPALESQALRKILSLALHPKQKLLFKIALGDFKQGCHKAHLLPLIEGRQDQYGLLVDIGDKSISVDDLSEQSVQAIAMSGDERVLRNELLSYQRRQVIERAAKSSIKTILLEGSLRSQRHYATTMKFDYIRAAE